MQKLKQEQIPWLKIRLVIFFFVFCGYSCLFSRSVVEADTWKKIKIYPNAVPNFLRSAEDLKAKAEAYNNEAIALFEEGRYAEAQELWEKAIGLMEHPQAQHSELETVDEEQPSFEKPESSVMSDEALETPPIVEKYQSGLSLLEQKEYGEAKRVFQEIDTMQPDYRNTKRYLTVIDELLREEDSPMEQEPRNDEAQEQVAADREEYPGIVPEPQSADTDLGFDPRQEETQWEEAVEQAEQKLQDQITESVEPIYQKALQHYKRKEYVEARDGFEQAQVLSPDYKLTAKYLDGIDDDILYAQQQKEEEQRLAEERARRQDELEFRKVVAAKEVSYRKEVMGKAEEIYRQAIEDFKNRKFEEAEDGFRKVDTTAPGYKLTDKYLGYIQKARDEKARLQAEEEARRQALAQHAEEEDMKRTVEESDRMRQQGLREKAEAVYQNARTDYGQGETEKARAGFSEVEQILPDYRSARKYLALIDEDVAKEKKVKKEQKVKLERVRQPEASADLIEKVETAVVPTSRKRLEAQELYRQAKESYKKREFAKAKALFEKVNAAVGSYQATEKFLARIDSDIQKETHYQQDMQEREARRQTKEMRYQQGLQRREAQRQSRKKAFEEKRATAEAAAARRRQETRELKETAARIKNDRDKMVADKIQELYREAESDYMHGLYALARERFNEVQRIAPGYRSTEEYLGNIAYAYGSEAAVETTPLPLRLEQEVLPVLAPAPVPVIQEEIVIPADEITAPKVAEPDDEVAADYDTGILLFKRKQYVRAREKLERVVQVAPGYKSTSEYLSRIDSLLQEEQQRRLEEQQQALARTLRREKEAKKAVPPEVVQQTVSEAQKPEPEGTVAAPVEASAQEREAASRVAKEKTAEKIAGKNQLNIQKAEEKKRARLLAQAEKKYAQALAACAKKDFISAKQKFAEVEKLSANFKETAQYLGRIDADIAAQNQKSTEVVAAYNEGISLFKRKQYVQAREKFDHVVQLYPDYKLTYEYLSRVDSLLQRARQRRLYEQQRALARAVRREEISRKSIPLVAEEAAVEAQKSEEPKEIIAPIEVIAKEETAKVDEQLHSKAQELFRQAEQLYASRQFVLAREKFLEVDGLVPDYKSARKYLMRVDQSMLEEQKKAQRAKERQEREVASRVAKEKTAEKIAGKNQLNIQKAEEKKRARLLAQAEKKYAQALAACAKKDFISAKQKFAEVEKLSANFKETAQYLGRIDADIAAQDQKPQEVVAAPIYVQPQGVTIKEQARAQADVLFHEAVRLYASKKFISAREKFYEAERLIPGYKTTGKYIALTDRAIARQQEKESRIKQIQDARGARLEADAQRERERVEKIRQENERKQQAQAKRVPAAAPAVKSVWVDPPDFNAFELTDDVGVLRRQYAQIQKERKGVQAAIRLRLDQTYAQAVRLYNQGYYAGAKDLFQEIAEIQPSFTGTKNYLAQIDQKLAKLPASAIMPGKGIEAPSVYVKPRKRVVTDALDSLEAPRQ